METALEYLLRSAGVLSIFVLVYHFLLRRLTFFQANRWFLLVGIMASITFPLIEITQVVYVEQPVAMYTYTPQQFATPMAMVHEQPAAPIETPFDYWQLLIFLYVAVVAFFLGKMAVELSSLYRLIASGEKVRNGKFVMVTLSRKLTPFSFFNYICFSNGEEHSAGLEVILDHEKVHARQWHSIDVLLSHLYRAVFWMNPLAWWLKKQIGENLEFIADAEAKTQTKSGISYERTLLSSAAFHLQPSLANNFFTPFIKKRIMMLQKEASARWNAYKYALILPVIVVFLYSFNVVTEVEYIEPETVVENENLISNSIDFLIDELTTDAELKQLELEIEKTINEDYSIVSSRDLNGIITHLVFSKVDTSNGNDSYKVQFMNDTKLNLKFDGDKVTLEEGTFIYYISDTREQSYQAAAVIKKSKEEIETDLVFDITSSTTDEEFDQYAKQINKYANYQVKFSDAERDQENRLQRLSISTKFPGKKWNKNMTLGTKPFNLLLVKAGKDKLWINDDSSTETLYVTTDGTHLEMEDWTYGDMQVEQDNSFQWSNVNANNVTISIKITPTTTKESLEEHKKWLKEEHNVDFDYSKLKYKKGEIVRIKIQLDDNKGSKISQTYNNNTAIPNICIKGTINGDQKSWAINNCKDAPKADFKVGNVQYFEVPSQDQLNQIKFDFDNIVSSMEITEIQMDSLRLQVEKGLINIDVDSLEKAYKKSFLAYYPDSIKTQFIRGNVNDTILYFQTTPVNINSSSPYSKNYSYLAPQFKRPSRVQVVKKPLVIIDGVVNEDPNYHHKIKETDIESMTVLKDSSATALYGEKGKDGVVIITTKAGLGIQQLTDKNEQRRAIFEERRSMLDSVKGERRQLYEEHREELLERRDSMKKETRAMFEAKREAILEQREALIEQASVNKNAVFLIDNTIISHAEFTLLGKRDVKKSTKLDAKTSNDLLDSFYPIKSNQFLMVLELHPTSSFIYKSDRDKDILYTLNESEKALIT